MNDAVENEEAIANIEIATGLKGANAWDLLRRGNYNKANAISSY